MSVRRLAIAALILFSAVYLKLFLPGFSENFMPALRRTLSDGQIVFYVPEEWMPWIEWS